MSPTDAEYEAALRELVDRHIDDVTRWERDGTDPDLTLDQRVDALVQRNFDLTPGDAELRSKLVGWTRDDALALIRRRRPRS